jgi:hypothetical protein
LAAASNRNESASTGSAVEHAGPGTAPAIVVMMPAARATIDEVETTAAAVSPTTILACAGPPALSVPPRAWRMSTKKRRRAGSRRSNIAVALFVHGR